MATYYTNASPRWSGNTANCYVVGFDVSYDSNTAKGGSVKVIVDAWIYCSWSAYNSQGKRSIPYVAFNQDYVVTIDGVDGDGSYKNKIASPDSNSDWDYSSYGTCGGITGRQRAYLGRVTRVVPYTQGTTPTITIKVRYLVLNGNNYNYVPRDEFNGTAYLTLPKQTPLTIGSATISPGRDEIDYACSITSWGTGASASSYYWEIDAEEQAFYSTDYVKVKNYLENGGSLTNAEIAKYDISRNGYIDADDMWSIRYNASGFQQDVASGHLYYFLPNTKYNWKLTVTNSLGATATKSGSFTTDGNYPTITAEPVATSTRDSISVSVQAKADYGDEITGYNFSYGTSPSSGDMMRGPSTGTAFNLQPNTMYYYQISVNSAKGKQSTYKTGSIKTLCNAPSQGVITRKTGTTNTLTMEVSAVGDTNAPVKTYTLQYKGPDNVTKKVEMGSATTTVIPGLLPDTNYIFTLIATNDGGSYTSDPITYSTTLTNPNITKFESSNILPFSCTVTAEASISPSRKIQYSFSKDGTNWTSYQDSGVYNWTGLSEETTYTMRVRVKAIHTSVNAVDTTATQSIIITTPADQAKVRIYKDKTWKKGKLWFKKGGTWKKAKKVYIKKGGQWVVGYNYEN